MFRLRITQETLGFKIPFPFDPASNVTSDFHPIAIIGIGCRFPGQCDDAFHYWNLLSKGRDAITETPAQRWNLKKFYAADHARRGKTHSRWGGYVDRIEAFDPALFGISPREAACMDPQQRMLLETAYRAAEDAGVPVQAVAGKPISVHVGISSFDYAVAGLSFHDRSAIGPYSNTGGSSSIAANRISYCFDLRGESVAIDTACSSSLIATHMACRSLQDRRNNMAFAGGVNALLLPDFYIAFSQLGVLSPDGRCKTFDAAANGYVRSEGAGMVLLKRLDDAIADGDRIYAVIHGSATNQDGRTEGITLPNRDAQSELIRTALDNAKIAAEQVSYVEAHGTGTPVGDPIEAAAIAECYGRSDGLPCHVGSVKTNIGHLEAGAGIASVIKVALALHHRQIPAHLNLTELHPDIPFPMAGLQVPTETIPWVADKPRLAGINGFGYGGANAHLIVGEAPETGGLSVTPIAAGRTTDSGEGVILLPLSAHSQSALAQTATTWADWLEHTPAPLDQIAAHAAIRRSHHNVRAAVIGETRDEWIKQLRSLAAEPATHSRSVHSSSRTFSADTPPAIAFVCCGQGPQWWAMGRDLLQHEPLFRERIERCDREFAKYVSWSLTDEFTRDETDSRMNQTAIVQPSLFALQVALADVWAARGVRPSIVVGHSVGEIAAAYQAGALTFADACCVAVHRGRTMDAATSKGAMIAAGLSVEEAARWIGAAADKVSIAAINGPTSLTISGCENEIASLQLRLETANVFCRRLEVEYAFHSPQMEPVRDELLRSLAGIQPQPTQTPMVSTVTGDVIDGRRLDAEYWWRNVRESVRFADAMDVLEKRAIPLAVEIGPHPVLSYAIAECFSKTDNEITTVASLHRKQQDRRQLSAALGDLYRWGYPLSWGDATTPIRSQWTLPPLVMDRQTLWSESRESNDTRIGIHWHPILGDRVDGASLTWQRTLDLRTDEVLADHRVGNACVLPAAAVLQMLAAAGRVALDTSSVVLRNVHLLNACLLSEDAPIRLQVTYHPPRRRLEIHFGATDSADWKPLATADVSSQSIDSSATTQVFDGRLAESLQPLGTEALYDHCRGLGLHYGPRFCGVAEANRRSDESFVRVRLPDAFDPADRSDALGWAAALWDSCFHGMVAADPDFGDTEGGLYLPQQIASLSLSGDAGLPAAAHVRIHRKDAYRMVADIDLYDADDRFCGSIREFESVRVAGTGTSDSVDDLLYRYVWRPSERVEVDSSPETPRKWIVFSDQCGLGREVIEHLPVADQAITVQHGNAFKRVRPDSFIIDPENQDHFQRLFDDIGDGVSDIVYLWGLDCPDNVELFPESLEKSTLLSAVAPLHLVQAWQIAEQQARQTQTARFAIVTRDSQPVDAIAEPICVSAGPLIGFGRVVASECGSLQTKLVDLSSCDASTVRDLVDELIDRVDDEDEIQYRDAIRWVRRFVPAKGSVLPLETDKSIGFVLSGAVNGGIDTLRYESASRRELREHEVEIETVASALNFSDVMKALGLYPGLPDGPVTLGAECSGRVVRVGSAVTEFRPGDDVVAIGGGAFASHMIVDNKLVAPKPKSLSYEQAACLPIAFLTADYALNECARLRARERVLIHSASGGVGIAAMQLAQQAGATVFATAGTDEKRSFVQQRGAVCVMNSRDLTFATETLQRTEGAGVDVVLNSLPGEAISRGMSILAMGGRFLEIGKRDIYSDTPLGLEPFKNNLAFFAIDLDQLIRQQPARVGEMLRRLLKRFDCGDLSPLPVTRFDADETRDAFRYMQQAKHIGKVAIGYSSAAVDVYPGDHGGMRLKADRTYWIAGGLGGFGMRLAQWLVDRGARHLVLGGRSGHVTPQAQQQFDRWSDQNVNVRVIPVDLASLESVTSVVERIERGGLPLAGVFHTAMVLEDRLITDLDRPTLDRVLRPKVHGGWNLHSATAECELDHFVLFSSLSSVFGHAGQANYSAANALLDSLAHYRRSIGLAATVLNWGHLGGVGYLAERTELSERLKRQGVLSFSPDEAMRCLEQTLQNGSIQVSVLRMDWALWRGLGITGSVSPRFAGLLRGTGETIAGKHRVATAEEIKAAPLAERTELLTSVVAEKAASLLGIEPEKLPLNQPLLTLGLDSLMAVELRNWVESQLQIPLPIADLMRGDGLDRLCAAMAQSGLPDPNSSASVTPSTEDLLHQLPEMSDETVDRLLAQMIQETESELPGE